MKYILLFFLSFCSFLPADSFSVLVVGGGPAGLAAAMEAKLRGTDVKIIEKRPSYTREQWVILAPSSLQLLEKWEIICPELKELEYGERKIGLIPICELERCMAKRVDEMGIPIIRGKYKKSKEGNAIIKTSKGKISLPYHLLIGADGAHSRVRKKAHIPLHKMGKATGAVAVLLLAPSAQEPSPPFKKGNFFLRKFPTSSGLCFLFGQTPSHDRIPLETFIEISEHLGWTEEVQRMKEGKFLFYFNGIEVILQQAAYFSNDEGATILIGDAAACASFFQGMGLNTALQTAVIAGDLISHHNFQAFNEAMRFTTDKLIEGSRYLFS